MRTPSRFRLSALVMAGALVLPAGVPLPLCAAQWRAPTVSHDEHDGGTVSAAGASLSALIVAEPDASWLRVGFDVNRIPPGVLMRITSAQDGATQVLDAAARRAWGGRSAYFNGDSVRIEFIAAAAMPAGAVSLERIASVVEAGPAPWPERSLCAADDRLPVDVGAGPTAEARLMPAECTAWLIGEVCMLSAGHCASTSGGTEGPWVVQFNVPPSSAAGELRHPSPEHQYPVDPASVQTAEPVILGNDWMYFGVLRNGDTGLSPREAQGITHQLAPEVPPADDRLVAVRGFGTVASPVPASWNQVLLESRGSLVERTRDIFRYNADTTGGNSGSPVIDLSTGLAIAVHTNAGCESLGGNQGTRIDNPALRAALADPQGVCRFRDCDADGINDFEQLALGLATDCNGDGILDRCQIDTGELDDCDGNGVPDLCEWVDCDGNGVLDACDLLAGDASDCNGNGWLDRCDLAPAPTLLMSGPLGPILTSAGPITHTFRGESPASHAAAGEALLGELTLTARADLGASNERLRLWVGGVSFGEVFVSPADGDCFPATASVLIPFELLEDVAAADGLFVELEPAGPVDNACLDPSSVEIELRYATTPRSLDADQDGIPDECADAPHNACAADITTAGANPGEPAWGVPDDRISTDDLVYFIEAWLARADDADLVSDGSGLPWADTGPDGLVTAADLVYFVELWVTRCGSL